MSISVSIPRGDVPSIPSCLWMRWQLGISLHEERKSFLDLCHRLPAWKDVLMRKLFGREILNVKVFSLLVMAQSNWSAVIILGFANIAVFLWKRGKFLFFFLTLQVNNTLGEWWKIQTPPFSYFKAVGPQSFVLRTVKPYSLLYT